MKKLIIVSCILAFCLPLQAQRTLRHKVVLQNGTILRGRLVETADSDSVRIKTADGCYYSFAFEDVKEVGKTPWKERRIYPFNRTRSVFFRPELGLGIGGSIALSTGIQFGPRYALYCGWGTWLGLGNYVSVCHSVFIGNLFHFSNNRNSMYMDFRIGGGKEIFYLNEIGGIYRNGGVVSFGIGKSFGAVDVGLYGSLMPKPYDHSLNPIISLSMAYNLRKAL